jgi:hypothetical protein
MFSLLLLGYVLVGLAIACVCQASLIDQADRVQVEMVQEGGPDVPFWSVLALYIVLVIIGWPFFLAVSIERKP